MTDISEPRERRPMLPANWSAVAPALRSRNFRLFWFGQSLSLLGTSLQVIAEGYLIYQLTQSTLWLGMVPFFALLPVVPISFLGGVLIDHPARSYGPGCHLRYPGPHW